MAAKEEAMAVEDMEVGLDYLLPWDKLELKTAAPKSCAEIRLSPTYLRFRVILTLTDGLYYSRFDLIAFFCTQPHLSSTGRVKIGK